jgi:hypothetical protein
MSTITPTAKISATAPSVRVNSVNQALPDVAVYTFSKIARAGMRYPGLTLMQINAG